MNDPMFAPVPAYTSLMKAKHISKSAIHDPDRESWMSCTLKAMSEFLKAFMSYHLQSDCSISSRNAISRLPTTRKRRQRMKQKIYHEHLSRRYQFESQCNSLK